MSTGVFSRQAGNLPVVCIYKSIFSSKNVYHNFLQIPKLANSVCSESVMNMRRCLDNSDDNYRQTLQRFV